MLKRFPVFLLFILLSGCFGGRGVYHTVGRGETLWRISKTYGVDIQDVAEINNIKDPTGIEAGSRIFIPGVSRVRKVVPYGGKPGEKEKEDRIVVEHDRFSWPVKGEIISQFGPRSGARHDGIDIKAEEGAAIKAAAPGTVVYSSSDMRGYGNIIIIKHKDDFYTVYAHNKENLVKPGDNVEKGATIGSVGDSGNAKGCHLHFEVREGKKVRNPLFFLP